MDEPSADSRPPEPFGRRTLAYLRRPRTRRIAARLLLGLGLIVLLAGVAIAFSWRVSGDRNEFAANARQAAADPRVQEAAARGISDLVVARVPSLVSVRPVILRASRQAVQSEAFLALVFVASLNYHDLAISRHQASISIDLGAMGTAIASITRTTSPGLAGRIPGQLTPGLVLVTSRGTAVDLLAAQKLLSRLAWILPLVALAFLCGAVAVSTDRRRTVLFAGLGAAAVATVFYLGVVIVHASVVRQYDDPITRGAVDAVLDAFLGSAPWWALAVGGAGLVAAGCARAAGRGRAAEAQAADAAKPPGRPWLSGRRATAFGAAGALVLAGGLMAVLLGAGGDELATTCNEHDQLCGRRLDQVAFATSHNAMAAADGGFLGANQTWTVPRQLDAGVRAMQIDTYYGRPVGDRVITSFPRVDSLRLRVARRQAQAAVDRLQARVVGEPTGPIGTYACHSACELGAIPLVDLLVQVRQWLDAHPTDVLVVVIEDYISPQATEQAFREAGLLDRAHVFDPDGPLPTLRELVDRRTQLVVMAENEGLGPATWYPAAYQTVLGETPYNFRSVAELKTDASCAPDRGGADRPLFLLNHFVIGFPVSIRDAQAANAEDVLGTRARRCMELRGQLPNLLAIDFVDQGALFRVVDDLNGVSAPSS